MDYTPVIFEKYMVDDGPTFGHALAQAVLFESAWTHFASAAVSPNRGYLKVFETYPAVKSVLQAVPAVWDDTLFLEGDPETHTVLARVKDQKWFIGGFNATNGLIDIKVDLNFIGSGRYQAVLIEDAELADQFKVTQLEVIRGDSLRLTMAGSGGFTVMLLPQSE